MARRSFLNLFLAAAAFVAVAGSAEANGWNRGGGAWRGGGGCCWHGGSRSFFLFNFSAPIFPALPYSYYYPPPPPIYVPPPAVYPQPQAAPGPTMGGGCREYAVPITVGGQRVQGYGIACPQPDGTWKIIK